MIQTVHDLLEQHFDTAFTATDGIAKMRELILNLAMQGKLVEQNPNDPPASELLKEIEAEKQRLIADKKIRKQKPLPPIKPEEVPYELPPGWEWVRLIEIGSWALGSGLPHSIQGDSGQEILLCKVSDMNLPGNEKFIVSSNNSISEKIAQESRLSVSEPGTIIFPKIGGAIATNKRRILKKRTVIDNNCLGITPASKINLEWCYQLLLSFDFAKYQVGTSVPAISQGVIGEIVIGLPPSSEQHRIVARIDQLMARCDGLEKLRQDRDEKCLQVHSAAIRQLLDTPENAGWPFIQQHFGELYSVKENVAELRKAILQIAVMGRLVPQDSNDPPASELLNKIEAEKQRLVKEKRIKKPKQIPSISQNEMPFQVPDNWCWVRIADLAESIDYGTSKKTCDDSSLVPVYRMGNIVDGKLIDEGFKYIEPSIDELPRLFLQPNDILFNRTNSYELVGKSARYTGPIEHATFASYLIRVRLFDALMNPVFLSLAMNAPYFRKTQIEPKIVQQCGQANFNGTKLSLCVVPLPPLSEQNHIARCVNKLMALCDTLDSQIQATTRKHEELLNAVMAQV